MTEIDVSKTKIVCGMISNIKRNLKIANSVHHDMLFRALVREGLRGLNGPPISVQNPAPELHHTSKKERCGAMHRLNCFCISNMHQIETNSVSKFQFILATLHGAVWCSYDGEFCITTEKVNIKVACAMLLSIFLRFLSNNSSKIVALFQ